MIDLAKYEVEEIYKIIYIRVDITSGYRIIHSRWYEELLFSVAEFYLDKMYDNLF